MLFICKRKKQANIRMTLSDKNMSEDKWWTLKKSQKTKLTALEIKYCLTNGELRKDRHKKHKV